jgi:hypothetical protein
MISVIYLRFSNVCVWKLWTPNCKTILFIHVVFSHNRATHSLPLTPQSDEKRSISLEISTTKRVTFMTIRQSFPIPRIMSHCVGMTLIDADCTITPSYQIRNTYFSQVHLSEKSTPRVVCLLIGQYSYVTSTCVKFCAPGTIAVLTKSKKFHFTKFFSVIWFSNVFGCRARIANSRTSFIHFKLPSPVIEQHTTCPRPAIPRKTQVFQTKFFVQTT